MKIPPSNTPNGFVKEPSELETKRFGYTINRYFYIGNNYEPLVDSLQSNPCDIAIVRIPTNQSHLINIFNQICKEAILADCMAVYTRDNLRYSLPSKVKNEDFQLKKANEEDCKLLNSMTETIFKDYKNHYSSNPLLRSRANLVDAYKEWVHSYVKGDENKKCYLASVGGELCGFATVRLSEEESEGVLYGVLPNFRRRGIYRDLIRSTTKIFVENGSPRTIVSTQIENYPVQTVWATEGFKISHSFYTLHLNYI